MVGCDGMTEHRTAKTRGARQNDKIQFNWKTFYKKKNKKHFRVRFMFLTKKKIVSFSFFIFYILIHFLIASDLHFVYSGRAILFLNFFFAIWQSPVVLFFSFSFLVIFSVLKYEFGFLTIIFYVK